LNPGNQASGYYKAFLLLCAIILTGLNTSAQESERQNWHIGSRLHYGFMHPFRMSIKYNVTDHIHGFELFAGKQYCGAGFWDSLYRYPETGIAYYYGTLGNNDVFGRAHAIYPYFSASFYSGSKYKSSYLVGAGVSYITKTFDLEENNFNILIGSHLNAFLKFALQNEYRISEELFLTNEILLIHTSNGRMVSPNKGLNMVTASIGLKYLIAEPVTVINKDLPDLTGINSFEISGGYATKMIDHFNTGRHSVINLSFDYSRRLTYKRELMGGFDYSYDASLLRLISENEGEQARDSQALRIGIHAGQQVRFYDIGIIMQVGVYLHNKWKNENHSFYQRYGIRYFISERLFAEVVLKTHLGVADYMTWGMGYKF